MAEQRFNLTTDPWIKVFDSKTNAEDKVSMIDFFQNAQNYLIFTGEMKSQDVSTMRFLLAILTTAYSRCDIDGTAYPWMGIDDATEALREWPLDQRNQALLETWQKLHDSGKFSATVIDYLKKHSDDFDFFGERPFYQATAAEYDSLVPAAKSIEKGKGIVRARQINRTISESGNSSAIFAPKSEDAKDQMKIDELIRWVIMYQNDTGVTDKTKITVPKNKTFRANAGWLYKIDPLFAEGNTLFDTMLANLLLISPADGSDQHPVWEWPSLKDYAKHQQQAIVPTNLAELYTVWSRVLHVEWDAPDRPVIYSASLPMFDNLDAFVEPMTAWHYSKKFKTMKPNRKPLTNIYEPMWSWIDDYFVSDMKNVSQRPGIIKWFQVLNDQGLLTPGLRLTNITLVSEENQSSQSPVAEYSDDVPVDLATLLDKHSLETIREAVAIIKQVQSFYLHFMSDIATLQSKKPSTMMSDFSKKFFAVVNEPFRNWLSSLSPQDDFDSKLDEWRNVLSTAIRQNIEDIMRASSPQLKKGRTITDDSGKQSLNNIFTARSRLLYLMNKAIKESREDKAFRQEDL